VKDAWDKKLVKWQRHNVGRKLPKHMFSQVIAETWEETPPVTIVNVFRKAGIVFNNQVMPRDKFDVDALKRWDAENAAPTNTINHNGPNTHDTIIIEPSMPSTSTVQSTTSTPCEPSTCSMNRGFEALLLDCVRQQHQHRRFLKKEWFRELQYLITAKRIPPVGMTESQKVQTQHKVLRRVSCSSTADSELSLHNESDDDEEFLNELENSGENDLEDDNRMIEVDKWVQVQYATKKTLKHYVGRVIEKHYSDAWLIRFVRYRNKKFIWPNVEDEAIVDSANIVRILPNLTEYQRGISFSVKVDGFNINLLPSSNSYLLTENETFS
jgi:hypothetical protein